MATAAPGGAEQGFFSTLFGSPDVERLLKRRDLSGLIEALNYGDVTPSWLLRTTLSTKREQAKEDRARAVRTRAAEALAQLGGDDAFGALIRALKLDIPDEGNFVRWEVVRALQRMDDRRAIKPLIDLLNEDGTTDSGDIEVLTKALSELTGETFYSYHSHEVRKEKTLKWWNRYGQDERAMASLCQLSRRLSLCIERLERWKRTEEDIRNSVTPPHHIEQLIYYCSYGFASETGHYDSMCKEVDQWRKQVELQIVPSLKSARMALESEWGASIDQVRDEYDSVCEARLKLEGG